MRLNLNNAVSGTGVLLSSLIGLLFYLATAKSIESDSSERFRNMGRNAQSTINSRIKSYTDVLRGSASMFQTNEGLTRAQFHEYVAGLELKRHFPGIETINFARHVTDAERDAFEMRMQKDRTLEADGYSGFHIRPKERKESYEVLLYVEPIHQWASMVGLDLGARPAVEKSIAYSRDTGVIATSGTPLKVLKGEGIGLGMRLPIYRARMETRTVEERRAAYLGSIGIGFSVDKLMTGVLDELPVRNVRLTLSDQQSGNHLFDSAGSHTAPPPIASDSFTSIMPVDFNGRTWQAVFSVDQDDLYTGFDTWFPWAASIAGFVVTMLLHALFAALSSSRLRAIRMAKEMTKELRDSEARLQLSHQNLRRLAAHADQIKEDERKRIAREIHDDLGQNLLALRIEADILASRTASAHPRLNARARATLSQIDATIRSVRQIINDLRPNVLDLGLNAAVDWQVADFQRRTGIMCELVEIDKDIALDDHFATAFFRILQESLANIQRHAGATHVRVELQINDDELSMAVSDNGKGIDAASRDKISSFGLVGIEERMKLLNGTVHIISAPGAGTTLRVTASVTRPPSSPDYVESDGTVTTI
jgi:signal transduction histidine kinase